MENNTKSSIVEVDYVKIPVLLFYGEPENIQTNIVYTVDDNGLKTLVTTEEDAKNILYNSIIQTKEEQEIINKFKDEDQNQNTAILELPTINKNFVKDFNYSLTLEFIGYNDQTNNPQFNIIYDTITGIPEETVKVLNDSKII
jgi:hypothetical protein